MPGLVVERLDPGFLAHALSGVTGGIVVVTGTNGKTTTTKMLAALMRAHGKQVFTNPTGSNFTRGVISSMLGELPLSGRLEADVAVLELDEWHALQFAKVVRPTHALLLNVARDQLDRFAEIDTTARLLATLATETTTGVILNRDDSFVARIRTQLRDGVAVRYFGTDPAVAESLPPLHEADVRFMDDFAAPRPTPGDGLLHPHDERSFSMEFGEESFGPVELRQRGLAAMINATAATTTARMLLGDAFTEGAALEALRAVTPPFGRGEVIDADGHPLELVLVKNPAGFTVALSTYGSQPVTTMIAINDDYADGQDVSWLYDVSFESLRSQGVALTTGVRAYDMALRLEYDDVRVEGIIPDLEDALGTLLTAYPHQPRRIFCTYTAMMGLRRLLAARYGLVNFGEEPA
jgi:UDP-N-acetylmuramyl tripeptide synthase